MANTLLTPTAVTREALRVLHQKLFFIGSINRSYDDSFAKSGAKIGDSLKIRLPNQYVVRDGATLSTQDTAERSVTLTVGTQKGVDLNFTSVDLTLSLDDFSTRILEPAMAQLASAMEADALNMRKDVYQQVNNIGAAATFAKLLQGRKKLQDSLTPSGDRTALLNTQDNVDMVDALKGLFNDQTSVGKQYREGYMGRTAGFDFGETTHLSTHARSTAVATGYLVNDAAVALGDTVLTVDTGTGAFVVGDIITIAGVNSVHPETKIDSGLAQQFVVTAASAGGGVTLSLSPAMYASGPLQNITAVPADNAAITVVGTVSTPYGQSLLYHKDAFAFVSADLVLPSGVDFAKRETFDGISMRIVRAYDINNDKFPARLDVLYGYKTIRPQWACRLANN